MNIFTALSPRGDNKLRETNLSAVLAYFLDPAQDHGLGALFIGAFLDLIESKTPGALLAKTFVETEQPQRDEEGNMYFDVVVELRGRDDNEILHAFIVENKINSGAANAKQLNRYYKMARGEYDEKTKITMVFLTPQSQQAALKTEYDNLSAQNKGDNKTWLRWSGGEQSVQTMIRGILQEESDGQISPINEYAKHTLKAFAVHLNTLLPGGSSGSSSGSKRAADDYEEDEVYPVLGYEIVTTNGGKYVYVRNEQSGERVVAMPALREINEKFNLGVGEKTATGARVITHNFGHAVINALKDSGKI